MSKIAILLVVMVCYITTISCSEFLHHDYDIQFHPVHGHDHYGHGEHGFATSIRYDSRHQAHKIPDYGHHEDVVYKYISDGHHGLEEGHYGLEEHHGSLY